MANIASQIKRNRQNEVRRALNKTVRSRLKTVVKQFRSAAAAGDAEAARATYDVAARELDKAASKGVIHRNTAANRKSGMARALNNL
jgi:small subunit ribosomal protein S20